MFNKCSIKMNEEIICENVMNFKVKGIGIIYYNINEIFLCITLCQMYFIYFYHICIIYDNKYGYKRNEIK